mmetsp:Transcript_16771/g.50173  ORF Transcript_16771/g.50173 Transcript_16771/m.50173 type:complete len:615 (-) Transcript_16771:64-1908(-)
MTIASTPLLLLSLLLPIYSVAAAAMLSTCPQDCVYPPPHPLPHGDQVCLLTRNGSSTIANRYCSSWQSSAQCFSFSARNAHGPLYPWIAITAPGECGCPNGCYVSLGRGECVSGACLCNEGWTGSDCGLMRCVSDQQQCAGHGSCLSEAAPGIDSCVCEYPFTGRDCNTTITVPPKVPSLFSIAQYQDDQYQDAHPLFNESTLATVLITMDPRDLIHLLKSSQQESREYMSMNMSFFNGVNSFHATGSIRIQGSGSRAMVDKSFKLKFNSDVAGLSTLSLKAGAMDPSLIREKASQQTYRSMDVPSQRMSYSDLFINGMNFGTHLLIEPANTKQFTKSRFGNHKGGLWKCTGGCLFTYDPSQGPLTLDQTGFEADNSAGQNATVFLDFIEVMNTASDEDFEAEMRARFDVDGFLRTLVASVLTGNWDGLDNGNNMLFYFDTDAKLLRFVRYDLDMAFGSLERLTYNFATRNIWTWGDWHGVTLFPGGLVILKRFLAVPNLQAQYAAYMNRALDKYFSPELGSLFMQRVSWLRDAVSSSLNENYWHQLDYMFDGNDAYENVLSRAARLPGTKPISPAIDLTVDMPWMCIHEFIQRRVVSARFQLKMGPSSNATTE